MIIRRRCDVPMARSKKLLPCEHDCKSCVACIERDDSGQEAHAIHDGRTTDPRLLIRNINTRRRHGDYDSAL